MVRNTSLKLHAPQQHESKEQRKMHVARRKRDLENKAFLISYFGSPTSGLIN
jgi:hypothetical protein